MGVVEDVVEDVAEYERDAIARFLPEGKTTMGGIMPENGGGRG